MSGPITLCIVVRNTSADGASATGPPSLELGSPQSDDGEAEKINSEINSSVAGGIYCADVPSLLSEFGSTPDLSFQRPLRRRQQTGRAREAKPRRVACGRGVHKLRGTEGAPEALGVSGERETCSELPAVVDNRPEGASGIGVHILPYELPVHSIGSRFDCSVRGGQLPKTPVTLKDVPWGVPREDTCGDGSRKHILLQVERIDKDRLRRFSY
ncbi:uncharacterized protein B0H18DRAFT_955891 [Fomitopsis serialis]|uniref:uncharacterized protein n=1 Tax=Fomitopsis serialis TaxID=139415 RepID=UPI0020073E40|nr:uncharacterized protein B0H18DRAFT_955888 [Neoantrodia serialis]XP_047891898.1 uncharacterized protein B0H18DRAFT_955891 [Neoantrodia serialis]KAH9923338.1 hypothetical protein B0H18DRAFT_955888 [Neoantrodia serialis]KAH9923344.1 hypothetical protein B0H18DRAFT_955891 [Neoantrodia serialis]